MKTLQNNFTTIEQSKRLLELGVPADSADMYIPEGCTPYVFVQGNTYSKAMKNWGLNICDNRVTPCWSVGRLMEIVDIVSAGDNYLSQNWDNTLSAKETSGSYVNYIVEYIVDNIAQLNFSKLEE